MERRPEKKEEEKEGAFSLNRLLLTLILSIATILGSTLYARLHAAGGEETDTRRESCIRACNNDQANCRDTATARLNAFDAPDNVVGAGANCDRELQECLKN